MPLIALWISTVSVGSLKPFHQFGSGLVCVLTGEACRDGWAERSFHLAISGGFGGVKFGPTVQLASPRIKAQLGILRRMAQCPPPPDLALTPDMNNAVGIMTKDRQAVIRKTSL